MPAPVRSASLDILLRVNSSQAKRQLRSYERQWMKMRRSISNSAKAVARVAVAAAAAMTVAYVAAIKKFSDLGDELGRQAKNAGLSIKSFQLHAAALETFGLGLQKVSKLTSSLSKNISLAVEGTITWKRVFNALNLDVFQLQKLAPEQQFRQVVQALAGLDDTARIDILSRLGGQWQKLGALSIEVYDNLIRRGEYLNVNILEDNVTHLGDMAASIVLYGKAFQAAFAEAHIGFTQTLFGSTTQFDEFIKRVTDFIRGAGPKLAQAMIEIKMLFMEYKDVLLLLIKAYIAWKVLLVGVAFYGAVKVALGALLVAYSKLATAIKAVTLAKVKLIAIYIGVPLLLYAVAEAFYAAGRASKRSSNEIATAWTSLGDYMAAWYQLRLKQVQSFWRDFAVIAISAIKNVLNPYEALGTGQGPLDPVLEQLKADAERLRKEVADLNITAGDAGATFFKDATAAAKAFGAAWVDTLGGLIKKAIEAANALVGAGKEKLDELKTSLNNILNAVAPRATGEDVSGAFSEVGKGFTSGPSIKEQVKVAFTDFLSGMQTALAESAKSWTEIGKSFAGTLKKGLSSAILSGDYKQFAQNLLNKLAESLLNKGLDTLFKLIGLSGSSHAGGIVGGSQPGKTVLRAVQVGEEIRTRGQQRQASMKEGMPQMNFNFYNNGNFDPSAVRAVRNDIINFSNMLRNTQLENSAVI